MNLVQRCLPLLVLLGGCATDTAARVATLTALPEPDEHCTPLGGLAVHMSFGLVMSEDALLSTAVTELRARAAMRGATHLVVSRPPLSGMVAYGTTAAASGLAFRCPEDL